jgi:holo-[acyl-carrier protein] synthase
MSVLGVGLDLVSIARVERLLAGKGDQAMDRMLTAAERAYCLSQPVPARHMAARLAAKEAAYKAFQAAEGARGIGWKDTEVTRDGEGRPTLIFTGKAEEAMARLKVKTVHVSISHTDDNAAAVVVLST